MVAEYWKPEPEGFFPDGKGGPAPGQSHMVGTLTTWLLRDGQEPCCRDREQQPRLTHIPGGAGPRLPGA